MIRPFITWLVIFAALLVLLGVFGLWAGIGEIAVVLLLSIALTFTALRLRRRSARS